MPTTLPPSAIYYGLLLFCLLLALGLLRAAWQRPRRRQRWARMAAGLLATAALWLTAFPPQRGVKATRNEAILLTEGYQPDTLRQLLRRLGPGTAVWSQGLQPAPPKARALPSLLTLAEQQPALRRLHLLGEGLPAADLPILDPVAVQLHPAPFTGFRTALWNRQLSLGEVLQVEGAVTLPAGRPATWVALRAAGAVRDSVLLPKGQGAFQLKYQPKVAGRAVYELQLRRAGQVLTAEPLPVEVTTPQLPAVLLLASTPSFEFKFLKNHLGEAHYPVALRSSISRGLQQAEFVNQPARPLGRLSPALLAQYAVLIADAPALAGLSGAEVQAVQAALRNGRLGLLALAEAGPLPRTVPSLAGFAVLPRQGAAAAQQALAWPDAPAGALASLPAQLRPSPLLQPLVTAPGQLLLAARRRAGLGFVVVSVVPQTFPWQLQGRPGAYASFWNRLLSAAVPPVASAASWQTPPWPRPQQPLTLHLTAAWPEALPTVAPLAGGPAVRLALRQDTRLPEWSTAQFWASAPGWHQLRGPGSARHHFYVFPDSAWRGPELEARRQAVAQRATAAGRYTEALNRERQPWPAVWFFALFLLAAGYLWLEEKL